MVLTFLCLVPYCACAVAVGGLQEEKWQVQLKAFTQDEGALYALPPAANTGRLWLNGVGLWLVIPFISFPLLRRPVTTENTYDVEGPASRLDYCVIPTC